MIHWGNLPSAFRAPSFRARVMITLAALFVLLVSLRLHGSSIAIAAETWAPQEAKQHFVATPLLERMSPEGQERWRSALMAEPRYIRMDEWGTWTLWAFAQFSHVPRFPVINQNVGGGQNMLTQMWVPVTHVSSLARPMTWGYHLLGRERGLAWAWWSQAFICFAALYLLFELVVPGRPWLAVLGALWYTGSAYCITVSLWPAYMTGCGVLAMVCAYWMLRSARPGVIAGCGVGLGRELLGLRTADLPALADRGRARRAGDFCGPVLARSPVDHLWRGATLAAAGPRLDGCLRRYSAGRFRLFDERRDAGLRQQRIPRASAALWRGLPTLAVRRGILQLPHALRLGSPRRHDGLGGLLSVLPRRLLRRAGIAPAPREAGARGVDEPARARADGLLLCHRDPALAGQRHVAHVRGTGSHPDHDRSAVDPVLRALARRGLRGATGPSGARHRARGVRALGWALFLAQLLHARELDPVRRREVPDRDLRSQRARCGRRRPALAGHDTHVWRGARTRAGRRRGQLQSALGRVRRLAHHRALPRRPSDCQQGPRGTPSPEHLAHVRRAFVP